MPKNYNQAADYLADYQLQPALLDALAWASLIGGIGDFASTKTYLYHFANEDAEDVCQVFENLVHINEEDLAADEVNLLLPEDDVGLAQRLRAMALWCDTFVSALGLSKRLEDENLKARINGHLMDLAEISKLDADTSGDYASAEAAELDFMELYEFLRVAVLSLELEFKSYAAG